MPFKGNRIILIVCLIVLVLFAAGIAYAYTHPTSGRSNTPGLSICTINYGIGIQSVKITNQNTAKTITKTAGELPFSFNFTEGDMLSLTAYMQPGFTWNAWEINQHPWFDNNNPTSFRSTLDVVFTPNCIAGEQP